MHARNITHTTNADHPPPSAIVRSTISQTDGKMTVETTAEIHVEGRLPVLAGGYVTNVVCELRLIKNNTISTEIAALVELAGMYVFTSSAADNSYPPGPTNH